MPGYDPNDPRFKGREFLPAGVPVMRREVVENESGASRLTRREIALVIRGLISQVKALIRDSRY